MDFREELRKKYENGRNNEYYILDSDLLEFSRDSVIPNSGKLPVLYRYTPADYYNIRSLEKEELFLVEAGRMNDVFEGLSGELSEEGQRLIGKADDLAYIKAFSESGYDNLVMWGNYADNYSGMCVEYDLTNIKSASENKHSWLYHLFPVVYSEKRAVKNDYKQIIEEHQTHKKDLEEQSDSGVPHLKDIMGLYTIKPKAWEYEQEWRIIVTHLQMTEDYIDVEEGEDDPKSMERLYGIWGQRVHFPYITRVFMGPRMKPEIKEHIKEIAEKIKIEAVELELDPKKYTLKPKVK